MKRFVTMYILLMLVLGGCNKADMVYEEGVYSSDDFNQSTYEMMLVSSGEADVSFYIKPKGQREEILIGNYPSNTTVKFTNDDSIIESIRVQGGTFTLNEE